MAAQGGFSDQPHMCRMVRRFSGHTLAEIRRGMQEEEGFWLYRKWG